MKRNETKSNTNMEVYEGLPQSPKVKRKRNEVDEEGETRFISHDDEQSMTQDQVVHKNILSFIQVLYTIGLVE